MDSAIVRCQNQYFHVFMFAAQNKATKYSNKQKSQKTLDAVNIAAQDLIETGLRRQNQQK